MTNLAKIYAGWQKRHVDNYRFYENDIFCEFGKGFIEGLAKKLDETTKEAYWQFAKMAIWENEESGKNPSKFWQNLNWGDKEGNLHKWRL